jgi:hypothetical protein
MRTRIAWLSAEQQVHVHARFPERYARALQAVPACTLAGS